MLWARGGRLVALVFASVLPCALAAPVSAAVPTAWVANGPVYSIAHGGGKTYIGGEFTHVGPRTGHGVALNATSGAWNSRAEVAGGQVRAAIADGAGGWYIGGDFTHVAGTERRGLAHILSTGALDTAFRADVTNSATTPPSVRALLLHTSRTGRWLYVGGTFTGLGGKSPVANLGAVNPTTGAPHAWSPGAASDVNNAPAGGSVHALAGLNVTLAVDPDGGTNNLAPEQTPVIFAGGEFTHLGVGPNSGAKLPANKFGAVWGVGARKSDTAAEATGPKSIEGEVVTGNLGAAPGSAWAPMGAATTAIVRTLALGSPTGAAGPKLAVAVYAGGTGMSSTRPALGAYKFEIEQTTVAGTVTSATYSWHPNPACGAGGCIAPSVRAVAVNGDRVYFGGDFNNVFATSSTTVDRSRLAAFPAIEDPTVTTAITPAPIAGFNPTVDGMVRGLSVLGGTAYVAGDFSQPRGGLAAFDTSNSAPRDEWRPDPTGGRVETTPTGGGIGNVVATGGAGDPVFAGGSFTSIQAEQRSRLAAFDSGGNLSGWNPQVGCGATTSCEVRALDYASGRVYAGGDFDSVGTAPMVNLGAISAESGAPAEGWTNPVPSWDVLALDYANGKVYIGGAFSDISGQARNRLAAVDATTGALDPSFAPSFNDHVRAVHAGCDRVFVGGSFSKIGTLERSRIAALHPATGAVQSWNPDAQGTVYDIERDGNTVYAAGQFALIGEGLRQKIAALDVTTGKATAWNPSADATVRSIAITQDEVFAGGIFREIGGENRSRIASISRATGDATALRAEADIDAVVYAADAQPSGVVFGGSFRHVNERAAHGLAGFDQAETEVAEPCAPPPVEPPVEQPVVVEQEQTPAAPSPPDPPAGPLPDTTAPKTTRFRVVPRRAPVGAKRRFLWTLSESVGYRIVIDRLVRTRRGKIRPKRVGALTGLASAGKAKRVWRGKLRKRVLRRGRYRARLIVVDPAGNRARSKRIPFKITARRATAERRSRRP